MEGKGERPLRVATKFVHIAERYFRSKGIPAELIFVQGSVELAPLTGLADVIPIHARFRAQRAPIVGTTLEMFRKFRPRPGALFTVDGELFGGAPRRAVSVSTVRATDDVPGTRSSS